MKWKRDAGDTKEKHKNAQKMAERLTTAMTAMTTMIDGGEKKQRSISGFNVKTQRFGVVVGTP